VGLSFAASEKPAPQRDVHIAAVRVVVGPRVVERDAEALESIVEHAELLLGVAVLWPHDPVPPLHAVVL
jgi:hypothetical protein